MKLLEVPIPSLIAPQTLKINATGTNSCEQYRSLIEAYDWNVDTMMRIMKAESQCNPSVVNDNPKTRDYSIGLFQINLYGKLAKARPSEEVLKSPAYNISFAYELYKSGGYQQWTTFKTL